MPYLLTALLFLVLFIFTRNNGKVILSLGIFLMLFLILLFPDVSLKSSRDGLNLWLFTVAPSLFPFFIINDMLINLNFPERISTLLKGFTKLLFNSKGYGAYVFVISILSGYPASAKVVSNLIEQNKISPIEGQKILTFSSTSGPIFIIGAVGSGMLKSNFLGYCLYISHITGAILNGIFFRNIIKDNNIIRPFKSIDNETKSFPLSIKNALLSCSLIGGYIIFFSIILGLLNKVLIFEGLHSLLTFIKIPNLVSTIFVNTLKASIELTGGCNIISNSAIDLNLKLIIISFITGFSGLCIIGQSLSFISDSKINKRVFIISKFTQGIFSAISCYFLIKFGAFNIHSVPSFKPNNPLTYTINYFSPFIILLLIVIVVKFLSKKE